MHLPSHDQVVEAVTFADDASRIRAASLSPDSSGADDAVSAAVRRWCGEALSATDIPEQIAATP